MPAPSPRTKPSRSRSNGRLARVGLVVAGRQGGQQVEAGHAERVDHAVRAAGEHHVGVAAADDLGRLADRLRAGGAGGQAVGVRAPGPEEAGQVAGGRVRLLLGLADRVERAASPWRVKADGVDLAVAGRLVDEARRTGGSPAAPRPSRGRRRTACGRGPVVVSRPEWSIGHPGGGEGELRVPAVLVPAVGVVDVVGQVGSRSPRRRSGSGTSRRRRA